MKRTIINVLLLLMLSVALIVSCSQNAGENAAVGEELVDISFSTMTSRALTATREAFDEKEYVWKYEAVKDDATGLTHGQTTAAKYVVNSTTAGLKGYKITDLSQGYWNFTLYAYKAIKEGETVKGHSDVYSFKGTVTHQKVVKGNLTTVDVTVSPNTDGYGSISFSNTILLDTLDGGHISTLAEQLRMGFGVSAYETPSTPIDSSQWTNLKAGTYIVTVQVYDKDDPGMVYAIESKIVTVYTGLNTTIGGSVGELSAGIQFGDVTAEIIEATSPVITPATSYETVVFDSSASTITVTASLPTSTAKEILGTAEAGTTKEMTLTLEVQSNDTTVDPQTKKTSKVYDISLMQTTVTKNNTTGAVSSDVGIIKNLSTAEDKLAKYYLTATLTIDAGLDNVSVTHSTLPMIPFTGNAPDYTQDEQGTVGSEQIWKGFYKYDKSSGVLTIITRSFSPFQVFYTEPTVVTYPVAVYDSSGNLVSGYDTIEEAFANAEAGQTVKLLADTVMSSKIAVNKSVVLNLGGHTLTNTVNDADGRFKVYDSTLTIEGENGSIVMADSCVGWGFVDLRNPSGQKTGKESLIVKNTTFRGTADQAGLFSYRANGQSMQFENVNVLVPETNVKELRSIVNGFGVTVYLGIKGGRFEYNSQDRSFGVFQIGTFDVSKYEQPDGSIGYLAEGTTVVANYGPILESHGSVSFKDCDFSFTTDQGSYYESAISAAVGTGNTATVDGGSYSGSFGAHVYSSGGTIKINDGNFVGTSAVLKAQADNNTYPNARAVIEVNDGTFDGKLMSIGNAIIDIRGGVFNNVSFATDKSASYTGEIVITGGKFNIDPSKYLAPGYFAVLGTDEYYTVEYDADLMTAAAAEGLTVIRTGIETFNPGYDSVTKNGFRYADGTFVGDKTEYRFYSDKKLYILDVSEVEGTSYTFRDDVDGIRDWGNSNITEITINSPLEQSFKRFQENTSIKKVNFGEKATRIPVRMFYMANGLVSVTLPNTVTTIERGAFQQCANLETLVLPSTLAEIPMELVYSCPNLTTMEIPNTVTSIGDFAIRNVDVSTIVIPADVRNIGSMAFRDCDKLERIDVYIDSTEGLTIAQNAFQNVAGPYPTTYMYIYDHDVFKYIEGLHLSSADHITLVDVNKPALVQVTIDSEVKKFYAEDYASDAAAFDAAMDYAFIGQYGKNVAVDILQDIELPSRYTYAGSTQKVGSGDYAKKYLALADDQLPNVTINLNEHTIDCTSDGQTNISFVNANVTICNGTINGKASCGVLNHMGGGDLTISEMTILGDGFCLICGGDTTRNVNNDAYDVATLTIAPHAVVSCIDDWSSDEAAIAGVGSQGYYNLVGDYVISILERKSGIIIFDIAVSGVQIM